VLLLVAQLRQMQVGRHGITMQLLCNFKWHLTCAVTHHFGLAPSAECRVYCCHCCAGFSLSRALQIGLPAHVAAIEEVSEYASKVSMLNMHPVDRPTSC
jgi:hypothetical protein